MTPSEAIQGVVNACQPLPTITTGGQPTPEHLAALHEAGVGIVLDLRDPREVRPFNEPAAVQSLGMEYINVPVTPITMNDETLDRVLGVLRSAGDKPVFLHCGSANRVGGTLIPYLMLDYGLEEEDAVQQAMRIGLRAPDVMEWGLGYARSHRPKAGSEAP